MLQFDLIQPQLQGQQEEFVLFLWYRPCPARCSVVTELAVGTVQQEHTRAGTHHSAAITFISSLQNTSSPRGTFCLTARNRTHRQIKPKIKIRNFFLHLRPERVGECAMALFTFGLFCIESVVNHLLEQRDWLPLQVAMSLEGREIAKLEKKFNSLVFKARGRKFAKQIHACFLHIIWLEGGL